MNSQVLAYQTSNNHQENINSTLYRYSKYVRFSSSSHVINRHDAENDEIMPSIYAIVVRDGKIINIRCSNSELFHISLVYTPPVHHIILIHPQYFIVYLLNA